MDSTRFDNLTRALATAPTRRKAIGAIIATIGGALGLGGLSTSFAKKCKDAGDRCDEKSDCCSHHCCDGVCCGKDHICHHGKCVRPTKTTTTTNAPTTTTTTNAPTTTTTTNAPTTTTTTTAAPGLTKGTLLFHSFNT
jgi:hypothetical protein